MSIGQQKSKAFAIRIVKLYKFLTVQKKEFILSQQLLRSGTSIGANLAEAECAVSRSDFFQQGIYRTEGMCRNRLLAGDSARNRLSDRCTVHLPAQGLYGAA